MAPVSTHVLQQKQCTTTHKRVAFPWQEVEEIGEQAKQERAGTVGFDVPAEEPGFLGVPVQEAKMEATIAKLQRNLA